MLYRVVERYRAGAAAAIHERFRRCGRQMPPGLHYVDGLKSQFVVGG